MAPKHLHTQAGYFHAGFGHERLTDWRQECQLGISIGALTFVFGVMSLVEQLRGVVGQRAVAFIKGFHGQQHATHIRMHDDRVSGFLWLFSASQ